MKSPEGKPAIQNRFWDSAVFLFDVKDVRKRLEFCGADQPGWRILPKRRFQRAEQRSESSSQEMQSTRSQALETARAVIHRRTRRLEGSFSGPKPILSMGFGEVGARVDFDPPGRLANRPGPVSPMRGDAHIIRRCTEIWLELTLIIQRQRKSRAALKAPRLK